MYCVYKHTAPNGKVYIGVTRQRPEDRWQNGLGYRTQQKFYRAIQKYGWENFDHEILFEGLSFEEAEKTESELIARYRSCDNRCGYNVESGGISRKEVSEETKQKLREIYSQEKYKKRIAEINKRRWSDPVAHKKMSERFSGEKNPMYGRKLSEEHKQRLAELGKLHPPPILRGEDNYFYGKHHSPEVKQKISDANSGAKNGRARAVRCVETNAVYPCIRDAFRATGVRYDSISLCCRGKGKTAGGYHWQYVDEEV
jgi:group I intron endonuclease